MKGWRLLVIREASRRVRRFLFETYLNPARMMSDEPSSLLGSSAHSRSSG